MSESTKSVREALEELVAKAPKSKEATDQAVMSAYEEAIKSLTDAIHAETLAKQSDQVEELRACETSFRERNYDRWKCGFDMLTILRHASIEAGVMFQEEFLQHPEYVHDPLIGVLMRLHAHACRVMGEIESLLHSGYADGAHARWRSLHEIAVFAILIRNHGVEAAEDFIRYGTIEAVNGMESYQETAESMGRVPYSQTELAPAIALRSKLLEECAEGITSKNGWARTHVGASKFPKLQKAAGLSKWANDYKSASRSIHFDYREMGSLLGMTETSEDRLLSGPSNSGMTLPAHCAAIALVQVTGAFLNARAEDDECPIDYSTSIVMVELLNRMEADVGRSFMTVGQASSSR